MGTMFTSFKRQVGKDAGKALSNAVFGDGHSTPYRRVEPKVTAASITAKVKEEKFELENFLHHKAKIEDIASISVPEDKTELFNTMNQLLVVIKANKWGESDDENAQNRNEQSDALMAKYKQCLFAINHLYPNSFEATLCEKEFKNIKKLRFRKKYGVVVLVIIIFIVFAGIAYFSTQK